MVLYYLILKLDKIITFQKIYKILQKLITVLHGRKPYMFEIAKG